MKRLVVILMLIASFSGLYAQDAEFYTVAGKVTDSSSGEPLRYVSVGLSGSTIANVTNSEGVFTLKLPINTARDREIVISHLGYMEARVIILRFEGYDADKPYPIILSPVSLKLDAAVINASEAEALINTAYEKVRDNYALDHEAMTAFYREIVKKGGTKYLSLNEAILDIDKAPYLGYAADRAGIYKGRGTVNYDSSDTLYVRYQGGVASSLDIDLVKNPFAGVFQREMFQYYDFSIGESTVLNDKVFHCVTFKPKANVNEMLFRGKVYIESDSFAIGKVEFNMNVEDYPETATNLFILKKAPKTQFEIESASYVVNFKEGEDGLWYYDYGFIELLFNAKKKLSPFRQHYSIVSEMAVTDHKPGQIKIENESRLRLKDQLSERLQDFTDEDYWENYNVIEPDADIDAIVRRIVRQLRRRSETR